MEKLSPAETESALTNLPNWQIHAGQLAREWIFQDFLQAMSFVNKVAEVAESMGHHPDIDIRYNRVRIALVTHDAGGITALDTALAARISS